MMTFRSALAGLACLCLLTLAQAQQDLGQNDGDREGGKGQALSAEQFLNKAMMINVMEIQMADIAKGKATRQEVREFAERMIQDHKRNQEKLQSLKYGEKIVAADINQKVAEKIRAKLEQAEGKDFDRAYIMDQVKGHQMAVQLFEAQARSATDPELRRYAEESLPAIREHLETARKLAGQAERE